jgi:hypothetical protein
MIFVEFYCMWKMRMGVRERLSNISPCQGLRICPHGYSPIMPNFINVFFIYFLLFRASRENVRTDSDFIKIHH